MAFMFHFFYFHLPDCIWLETKACYTKTISLQCNEMQCCLTQTLHVVDMFLCINTTFISQWLCTLMPAKIKASESNLVLQYLHKRLGSGFNTCSTKIKITQNTPSVAEHYSECFCQDNPHYTEWQCKKTLTILICPDNSPSLLKIWWGKYHETLIQKHAQFSHLKNHHFYLV